MSDTCGTNDTRKHCKRRSLYSLSRAAYLSVPFLFNIPFGNAGRDWISIKWRLRICNRNLKVSSKTPSISWLSDAFGATGQSTSGDHSRPMAPWPMFGNGRNPRLKAPKSAYSACADRIAAWSSLQGLATIHEAPRMNVLRSGFNWYVKGLNMIKRWISMGQVLPGFPRLIEGKAWYQGSLPVFKCPAREFLPTAVPPLPWRYAVQKVKGQEKCPRAS